MPEVNQPPEEPSAASGSVPAEPGDAGQVPGSSGPTRRILLGGAAGAALAVAGCAPSGAPAARAPRPGASAATSAVHPAPTTGPGSPAGAKPQAIALGPGPDITHGPTTSPHVALTFHGQGPAALTRRVLAECRTVGAEITVFAVGTWVAADPSLIRAIAADGHDVGNHTWSHQQMKQLGSAQARTEVARGAQALRQAVGYPGLWFRPSGTHFSTTTIRGAARLSGYQRCISYDVDPEDFLDPGAALVRQRTRRGVRAGSIVSLHLGHPGTAEALPGILSDLSRLGLRPVTLTTLLKG